MRLAERLRARLAATEGIDLPFARDMPHLTGAPTTDAAVLVAITDRPEPGLILTKRPETMRRHPGQIAFPGGRAEPEDADAVATALREAEEEIALSPSAVEIVGTIESYNTISDFRIVPVLGVIPPDLPLVPHDDEVADLFEVPLGFVLDPANQVPRELVRDGMTRTYVEIQWQDRRIWGATAAMIANLARRLQ